MEKPDRQSLPPPSSRLIYALGGSVVAVMVLGLCLGLQRSSHQRRAADALKAQLPELGNVDTYVSSDTCRSCHPDEHASWKQTFHRSMTMKAVEGNVLGDFDRQTIVSKGLQYHLTRTNQTYWAQMPDPDLLMQAVERGRDSDLGRIPLVDRQVVMTTGSHHYQTYWVESPRMKSLLQTLPLVYLVKDQRWIPREAAFMRGPEDAGRMVTQWNHHCIRCHSTCWNPGLSEESGMLETKVAELGISCEACHGPGEAHVDRHRNPLTRYQAHLDDGKDPTIVNPARLDHERSSHVCGQCHGVFIPKNHLAMKVAKEGVQFRPGESLFDSRYYIQHPQEGDPQERWDDLKRNPQFFRERWWEDGSILAGGREFTAMSSSECYLSGKMSCLSCHSMHDAPPADQLKPSKLGRHACIQCHDEPRYTDRVTEHTFHHSDSHGSDCMNCHMPHTTYALFNGIRSHEVKSPRLEGSAEHGVPNACNLCHMDKTLAWTQEHLTSRYGYEPLSLSGEQEKIAAGVLWMIKGHAAQRVIAAWHMGWEPAQEVSGVDWIAPLLLPLLNDPYPVVRYVASRSLDSVWPEKGVTTTLPYDFMAPAGERDAVYRSHREFLGENMPVLEPNPAILVGKDGNTQQAALERMLKERNDRSVTIKE